MVKVRRFKSDNKMPPTFLGFENGLLNSNQNNSLIFKIYEKDRENLLVAAADQMIYSAKVNESEDYTNLILIRKKNSDKAHIIKTNSVILKPFLPKRSENLDENEVVDLEDANKSKMSSLNKQFGSKRARITIEQQERMTLNIENVKEQLKETVSNIEVKEEELVVKNQEDDYYRPPINRNATTIESVYVLEELISKDVLNSLTSESEALLHSTSEDLHTCDYITQKILELRKQTSDNNTLLKCKILLYVDCLIRCAKETARGLSRRDFHACNYSKVVNKDIFDKFTSGSGSKRSRSNALKNKTICYAVVLLILIFDYRIDLQDFARAVSMGIKALQEIARYLGLTNDGKTGCILKLPLPPPPSLFKGKKNKR